MRALDPHPPSLTPRSYTITECCVALKISRRTFERRRKLGILQTQELQPRIGRPRFDAQLLDAWLVGRYREVQARRAREDTRLMRRVR